MRRLWLAGTLVTTLCLSTGIAAAWNGLDGNDTSPHTAWPGLPVDWYLHSSGSADLGGLSPTRTIIQASFDSWMNPSCTVWETNYQGTTSRTPGPDGYQVIAWVESSWPFDAVAIGVASTYTAGPASARRIVEADISFNGEDYTWNTTGSGGVDTQSIATHEIGHFLGLDHDGCSAGETMCYAYGGGTDARTLAADDITGVCTVYPAGCGTTADCPPSFECVGGSCVSVPGQPCDPCDYPGECGGSDDYCLSGFPDGGSYCGSNCTIDDDCPWRFTCEDLTSGERHCLPYDGSCNPPPIPECDDDTDCTVALEVCDDLLCVGSPCAVCDNHWDCGDIDDYCLSGFPDSLEHCGASCTTDADCPWGYDCEAVFGGENQCQPYTGSCSPAPVPQCSVDGDCPPMYHCDDQKCVGELCAPCTEHWNCGENNACLTSTVDSNTYCSESCVIDDDCPWGYACTGTGLGLQCWPRDEDCETPPEQECFTDGDCTEAGTWCSEGYCVECATDEDCEDGEVCNAGYCVPEDDPGLPLCAECLDHAECGDAADLCISGFTDGVKRCGVACATVGGECGEGNTCMGLGSMEDQCLPEGMDCTGLCVFDDDCPEPEMCIMGTCTADCDPDDLFSCRDDHYCSFVSCDEGTCLASPDGRGIGLPGEECSSDLDCESLRCLEMIDGSHCAEICDPGADECPDATTCQRFEEGDCGYCSCSAGILGDECEADADCQSGLCMTDVAAYVCTRDCAASGCPVGYNCLDVEAGLRCAPALGWMGHGCTVDGDCDGGICIEHADGNYCSRSCTMDGCSCPDPYECTEGISTDPVCVDTSLDVEADTSPETEPDTSTIEPVPTSSGNCACTFVY